MASETNGSPVAAMLTVTDPTPVTTVPSGLVATAVMAAVPFASAVASPVLALMPATVGLLEVQTTLLVRFTVVPVPVVPMAMN
jgi:hypothetical protein